MKLPIVLSQARRSFSCHRDDTSVSGPLDPQDAARALLALYDEPLPIVHGYFVRRCADRGTAEDLTSETFLAACGGQERRGDGQESGGV
jgi:RNA polymerase sigma-70 factor, ECF subfamily